MKCVSPDSEFDHFFLSLHGLVKQAIFHMLGSFEERVHKRYDDVCVTVLQGA